MKSTCFKHLLRASMNRFLFAFMILGIAAGESAERYTLQLKHHNLILTVKHNKVRAQQANRTLWETKLVPATYHQLQALGRTLIVTGSPYKLSDKKDKYEATGNTLVYAINISTGRPLWTGHVYGRYSEAMNTISSGAVILIGVSSGATTVAYTNVYRLADGKKLNVPHQGFAPKASFQGRILFEANPAPLVDIDTTPEYIT